MTPARGRGFDSFPPEIPELCEWGERVLRRVAFIYRGSSGECGVSLWPCTHVLYEPTPTLWCAHLDPPPLNHLPIRPR